MATNLPPSVSQAGSLLQNPLAANDAQYRRMIIQWGRRQIEAEYPENPWAPLNIVRKQLALMEWDRVVRNNGRELRGVIAGAAVAELQFQLQRRQEEIRADDLERRRRDQELFNSNLRVQEAHQLSAISLTEQKELLAWQHGLSQQAEDAASRRRIIEQINTTEQEIHRFLLEAVIRTANSSSAEQMVAASRLVNDEITRIRNDPTLSPDQQHVQIKTLLDALPIMLRNLRPPDV